MNENVYKETTHESEEKIYTLTSQIVVTNEKTLNYIQSNSRIERKYRSILQIAYYLFISGE